MRVLNKKGRDDEAINIYLIHHTESDAKFSVQNN